MEITNIEMMKIVEILHSGKTIFCLYCKVYILCADAQEPQGAR